MASKDYSTFFESISVTSTSAGAGADVVYTVPAKHDVELTFLNCTNGSTVNTISVQIYHFDDDAYHYILRETSIPDNETRDIVTSARLYLHAGDKVVSYKTGGTFDVSVSGKLFYNPTRTV